MTFDCRNIAFTVTTIAAAAITRRKSRSVTRRSLSSGNAHFVDGWKLIAICADEAANQFGAGKMAEA
jgi:hypothetical protein